MLVLPRVIAGRISLVEWGHAIGLVWITISLLLAVFLPGASYLFLVPATLLVLGTLLGKCLPGDRKQQFVFATWLCAVGVVWIPLAPLFYDALGFRFVWVVAAQATIVTSALIPLAATLSGKATWRFAAFLGCVAVLFAIIAISQNRVA
jgi:hypothetical protein